LVVVAIAALSIRWNFVDIVGVFVLLLLGTGGFACLSMILASLVRTRERFMGIGQLVVMPLFFASSALYPIAIMPRWLQVIAHINPLSYEVHGMRELLPRDLGRRLAVARLRGRRLVPRGHGDRGGEDVSARDSLSPSRPVLDATGPLRREISSSSGRRRSP
jgi:hypothetical protein